MSSTPEGKETARAEPWLGVVEKGTEFFATAQVEAWARRTGVVRRTSTITGKVVLALVTWGMWSTGQTAVGQWGAKAAPLPTPVDLSPEALPQRLPRRAGGFLQALLPRAFAQLHTGETVGAPALFPPFTAVPIAESTGVALPPSLKDLFPGPGGAASVAGAKLPLVGDYLSHRFAHLALGAGTMADNQESDPGGRWAQRGALFLFELGYFKVQALAPIAEAEAYFLTRLNPPPALFSAVGGGVARVELPQLLSGVAPPRRASGVPGGRGTTRRAA